MVHWFTVLGLDSYLRSIPYVISRQGASKQMKGILMILHEQTATATYLFTHLQTDVYKRCFREMLKLHGSQTVYYYPLQQIPSLTTIWGENQIQKYASQHFIELFFLLFLS